MGLKNSLSTLITFIMKEFIIKMTIPLIIVLCLSTDAYSQGSITFNGTEYQLDNATILLDREDIYHSPLSIKDPAMAFAKINENGGDMTLLIAPSVYWIDDPDDPAIRTDEGGTPFGVRLKCEKLRMIGLADNPEDVVFAANRGQTQGAVGNFTMFQFTGNSLETENITFGNYCNIDLDYKRNPELNRKRRKDAIVQAQVGICNSTDKLYAKNCQFLSRLNLCPFVGARRSLYENCYFESTDDALSGSAIYLDCKFLFCSSKPFYTTDRTGAIFLNCDIKSLCTGDQYFTKVPGAVTAIDTRFSGNENLNIGWTRDASDIRCFQSNISLNGLPYIIDSERPELWIGLDDTELLDAYVVEYDGKRFYNLPNLLNGDDGWDPKGMNQMVEKAEKVLGKKLTGIPVSIQVNADKSRLKAQGDTAIIQSTPLLWGGYPANRPKNQVFISDNTEPVEKEAMVRISLPNGLAASQTLTMAPLLRAAPKLKKQPIIRYDINHEDYYVDYKLNGKGDDESTIYWARIIHDEGKTRAILMKKGVAEDGSRYQPLLGDYGNQLMAIIMPKFKDSHPGEMMMSKTIEIDDIDDIKEIPESNLFTDFSDIPIVGKNLGMTSVWSFDVYKPLDTSHVTNWQATEGSGWYYGKGFDASVSEGMVQTERGARMSYVPSRDICRNMSADLIVEPAKSGGQGFGSATAQYMDVCLKFDPISLDGYALRIERTPDYDKAVRFSLVKYEKGKTSVINEGVASHCYRTSCAIHVEIKDGILSASSYTDAAPRMTNDGILDKVNLSSPIEDSGLTGFCIQHTGSTGPSSTLIKNLKLTWE